MENLNNLGAERAVLAGICRHGSEAYFDVADIIRETSFTLGSNQNLFRCLKSILERDERAHIDWASILVESNTLGVSHVFEKPDEVKHVHAIMAMPINVQSVRRHAAVISKLEIARLLYQKYEETQLKVLDVTGQEPISYLLGLAEEAFVNFSSLITPTEDEPENIFEGLEQYLRDLAENPVEQIGLSTGYPVFDWSIGGGLRDASVNMVGGRAKSGKSTFALNVANFVSGVTEVPVLYLDTEMIKKDQQVRLSGLLTETDIRKIETGQFGADEEKANMLFTMVREAKERGVPFYYKNISGRPFEEIIAIARRWLVRTVGLNPDKTVARKCLIIYDYLKLMSDEGIKYDIREYQALGFMMTGLHNFGVRYNIPILALTQLNREGLHKQDASVVSGSDRIVWLCTNFSVFSEKSDEEKQAGHDKFGNRKMIPIVTRYGEGLGYGDYINMDMKGQFAKIVEGKTKLELKKTGQLNEPEREPEPEPEPFE